MKILHTGDWHFREKDHDEIYKCVRFIADQAKEEQPDLICISGDITDSRQLNLDSRSARSIFGIISLMLDIAPVAIVIGTPSHDGKAALALRECRGKYPILVSDMPGQYGYYTGVQSDYNNFGWHPIDSGFIGAEFILSQIPQPTKQYFVNDMAIEDSDKAISMAMDSILVSFGGISEKFDSVPHIVNGHGQIGGAFISETQQLIGRDIEISKSQLSMLNADLICYGHIHKAQAMGDNIFYSGSPTRMNHGETEEKGFYIHHIDKFEHLNDSTAYEEVLEDDENIHHSLQSDFIRTPAIYLHNAKFDLTKEDEFFGLEFTTILETMCDGIMMDHDEWGVKITITVWQDDAKNINKSEIEREIIDWGASRYPVVSIIRKPRETVRAERVLEAETLPDKLKAMAELRGENISDSIIDKASALEAKETEPWKILDKQ